MIFKQTKGALKIIPGHPLLNFDWIKIRRPGHFFVKEQPYRHTQNCWSVLRFIIYPARKSTRNHQAGHRRIKSIGLALTGGRPINLDSLIFKEKDRIRFECQKCLKRLIGAIKYRYWTIYEWAKVLCSNESLNSKS